MRIVLYLYTNSIIMANKDDTISVRLERATALKLDKFIKKQKPKPTSKYILSLAVEEYLQRQSPKKDY